MSVLKQLFSLVSVIIILSLTIGCDKQEIRPTKQQPHATNQTATPAPVPITMDENRHIHIDEIHATLPVSWNSIPPTSQMRKAQFIMEATGQFEPGEMAVFYLGPEAGGIEQNLSRWYNQFSQPDGKNTEEVVVREEFDVNGLKVIMVHFEGIMKTSTMPGMPDKGEMTNWMNLSAIVMTPNGPWFFKSTGPVETLKSHIPAMKQFLNSISVNAH